MRFVSIFAWTLATVAASPVPEPNSNELEKRQGTCNANDVAFRVINNLGARGSTFCNAANNIAFRVLSNLGPRGSIFCNALLNLPTSATRTTLPTPATTVTVPVISITGTCVPQLDPEVERGQSAGGGAAAAPAPEGKRDPEALEK